ncbi:MAG: autotransporter outer membrane beta-barrel domain-containing protein, partial [Rhodobacteraceae bacterium]|nr:autotransporter outer membrane beta-barrel domain-containing protein [Paracoccaceae bacterium]
TNAGGTVRGTLQLTGVDDLLSNGGQWDVAGGTSDFGAGADHLNNGANGVIAAAAAAGVTEVTLLNGLESLTNAGQIKLQDAGVGDRLVMSGNYGGAGGTLLLDANLQDGGMADVLRVDGNVTGTSKIALQTVGGLIKSTARSAGNPTGALSGDGIKLVDVGGTSTADAFTLVGKTNIGMYHYFADFGGATDSNQSWYLMSKANGGDAIWESTPAALLTGFGNMASLQNRLGGRLPAQSPVATRMAVVKGATPTDSLAPWLRLTGENGWVNPQDSDAEATWLYRSRGLQAGIDSHPFVTAGGEWVLGATLRAGEVDADIANAIAVGSVKAAGYGLGATATWYGANGVYVDAQAEVNRISATFDAIGAGQLAKNKGMTARSFSLEAGWKAALANGSTLTPQVQVTWARLSGGSFTDALGTAVDLGSNDRKIGRIGLAWDKALGSGNHYYVTGTLERDFSGVRTILVNGAASAQGNDATWAEIGLGGARAFGKGQTIYAEAKYKSVLGGQGHNRVYGVAAGFKMQW